jgi:hypothetical protein
LTLFLNSYERYAGAQDGRFGRWFIEDRAARLTAAQAKIRATRERIDNTATSWSSESTKLRSTSTRLGVNCVHRNIVIVIG